MDANTKKGKIGSGIMIIVVIMIIAIIFFMDFPHGYFCNAIDYNALAENEMVEFSEIPEEGYEIEFVPLKEYLAGFQICITNITEGELYLSVYEADNDIMIEEVAIDLKNVVENEWYNVYLENQLEKNRAYKLYVVPQKGKTRPYVLLADKAYLPEESISGNVLINYAYKAPLFATQEKILISMFVMAIGLWIAGAINGGKQIQHMAVLLLMISLLTQNYMYGSMDNQNGMFHDFQKDSEALVTGVIDADRDGVWFRKEQIGFGLGGYDRTNVELNAYTSQYGLQGKVFRHIARYMEYEDVFPNLNFLCAVATAIVFVILVWLLSKKYNVLLAGCFYITFWLSPWIVNFARNLYWVEFLWFLPMTIGCFCAWKVEGKKYRVLSYLMGFCAILLKSLCGYEYISTIMIGMISFLLVDFLLAFIGKNRMRQMLLLRTIFSMGVVALSAFGVALCVHARAMGSGNVAEGLKIIYEGPATYRLLGGSFNEFSEVLWPSFNASAWDVICIYFRFRTEVITGISGNLFPLLSILPLAIFFQEYRARKLDIEKIGLYVVFFIATISWYVLAKPHSYIHTHMNYVLWYFGFVQVCMYIIVENILNHVFIRRKD